MLRFGKTLGPLNREVSEIKIINSADPNIYGSIRNGNNKQAKKLVEKMFPKHKKY